MASKAKQDITGETALSAVEEALSVDFTDDAGDLNAIEAKIEDAASEIRNTAEEEILVSEPAEENFPPESLSTLSDIDALPPASPPVAANDEINPELANLLYSIQQKPSSRVFLLTFILTLAWLGLCAYYGYQNILPTIGENFKPASFFNSPELMTFAAVTILPLLPLWAFAVLVRRSQEMRHAANSMTEAAIQLLQPESAASDSVATVGRAVRREVTAIGDGVERAIARAGELEFMVQKEVMNLERSYDDSEGRLRRLVDEIGSERDVMIQHADTLKTAISSTHSNLTSDIEVVSNKIEETLRNATMTMSDTLEMRGETITTKLSDTSEGLMALLSNTGESLNAKISAVKDDLELNVSQTTESMANTITTNGKAVARLLETRTAGLQQATSLIDEKLEANKQQFETSFGEKTEELASIMQATGKSVNSLLKSTTAEIAEQSNTTIQKIEEGRSAFRNEMSEQSVEFTSMVENTSASVKDIMDASAADVAARNLSIIKEFEEKRVALNEDLAIQSSEITQSISQVGTSTIDKLETTAEDFEKKGDQIIQQIGDNLSIRASEFSAQVSDAGNTIQSSLENKLSSIDDTLTTGGNNLVGALGMRTEALGKVLQERTEAIGQTIGDRLSGFGQVLTDQVDGTVVKLQDQVNTLQNNTKTVEEVITSKTLQVEEAVRSSTINFSKAAEENLQAATEKSADINAALEATSADLTGSIDKAASQLTAKLGTTTKTLTDALDATSDDLTQKIGATTDDLNSAISANKEEFTSSLEAKQLEFVGAINTQTVGFSSIVDSTTETFSKAIEERSNNLSSKLSQGAHQISTALEEKSLAAAERMESSVKALDSRLSENSNTIENQFAAGNIILEENLAKGKEDLLGAISKSLDDVTSEIDGKAEKISELLTERADKINDKLGRSLVETQRNLEAKTSELNELLSARTTELSGLIDSEARPVISSIVKAGNETSEKLSSLSKMIGEEANTLFSNIGSSSGLLESLISDASANLNLMQNSLSSQIENFSNAVETTKYNVSQSEEIASDLNDKMQNVSNDMLIGIDGIAQRFEAQSVILQDATKIIDAAQSNLEVTLESKQDALQQLAVGLVSHSDQINTNMSSFHTTISSIVEDASSKSKNVGSEISMEISKAIEDATSRFDDAVNAMRSAASTMRTELEDTRAQMRKGILELPDETEKSASAMRRVVTDQIAALRDLSAIVEKSGKVLDASAANPAQAIQQPVAPQQSRPYPAAQQQVPAPRAPAQTSPGLDMALRGSRPAATPEPAQQQQAKSSGWVSDLLRRASEEERAPAVNIPDNRSPNQVVESLNSLSVDIANAIDHETSVELWDRYQRGETSVFTRRLYTLQGQQTFDEIQNKYSRNGDFRTAVDRYINDFEQLLGKETSNGQNQALTQSYLTSDTGKVYTMLAHASGRLGSQV